jgi:hypothetical protein
MMFTQRSLEHEGKTRVLAHFRSKGTGGFSPRTITHRFKGTVRPGWICMRVVPLESPLKGHQPLYVFDFLISVPGTEYLKHLQSSEPLHAKLNPTSCLFGSRVA